MKKLLPIILLMSQSLFGSEINFEVKAPFSELENRIEMQLTDEFVESLRPFARNLGRRLDGILERAADLAKKDAEDYIVRSLRTLVYEGDMKLDEMLSREVLERAILIHKVLVEQTNDADFGIIDMRIRLLTRAIEMAKTKYASKDLSFFDQKEAVDYGAFGKEYIVYLVGLNKSIFDASAQYEIQKLALKFYQYDLARDVNNQQYASDIVEIQDQLPNFPEEMESDVNALKFIRSLRKLTFSMDVEFPKPVEVVHETINYGSIEVEGYIEGKKFHFKGDSISEIYNSCVHKMQGGFVERADDITLSVNKNEVHYMTTGNWWYGTEICNRVKAKVESDWNRPTQYISNYISGYVENEAIEIRGENRWEAFKSCRSQVMDRFDLVILAKNGGEMKQSTTGDWWYRNSWCRTQVNKL